MLVGNKKTFGIDILKIVYDKEHFLNEDRFCSTELKFVVKDKIIGECDHVPGYSLAQWMLYNYDKIFEYSHMPKNYANIRNVPLIMKLRQDSLTSKKIASWIRTHSIHGCNYGHNLPKIFFVSPEENTIDLVWINGDNGDYATIPLIDIKNVFKYFMLSIAMHLKNTPYIKSGLIFLSRWRP